MNKVTISRIIAGIMLFIVVFTAAVIVLIPKNIGLGQPSPSVVPSYQPTPIPLTKVQFLSMLPIVEQSFRIEYFNTTDKLIITITENPYDQNKQIAEEWLRKKGIDPDKYNIIWTSTRNVQQK